MMDGQALMQRVRSARRRFDQRPQRERLLLAGAALALAVFIVDAVLVGPAYMSWKRAARQQQTALETRQRLQADIARLQAEHATAQRQQQAELASWRQRIRDGESGLRVHDGALVGPDAILTLIEGMLSRHGQVRLRSMQSLGRVDLLPQEAAASPSPASAANPRPAAAAASPTAGATAPAAVSLYRHGVELTVEGGFADLLDYVRALEAMPQRVLWGDVRLKVEQHPKASLTLRLYTISRDRHWLEI